MRNHRTANLDPQWLVVFGALARAGGVRGAATALGIPRTTVSRRLTQLEGWVGAPLVVRTTRRFVLTDVGARLFTRCEQLEELLRDTENLAGYAAQEPSGLLRIAAAPVIGEAILPGVLQQLGARYPRLAFDVRMSVDYVDLRRGDVDVAIRAWSIPNASDIFVTRIGDSVTGCYVGAGYASAHGLPRTPDDLASHPCIVVGNIRPKVWQFAGPQGARVIVDGPIRIDSFQLARSLCARGAGVARLAEVFAAPQVASGELVPVLEPFWPITPIHAVHGGPSPPAPKVAAFIELVKEAAKSYLPVRPRASAQTARHPS